ncbi:MAG: GIY-YIG nuclease family protein [Proteobacteria bacterium]|nr:GIY-YIG nuclease family protein [Pseudomonadota bacterium]
MKSGIYIIRNLKNYKVYVGSATNIKGRWSNHICSLQKGRHDNSHLQRAWNKYGEEAFEFKVLIYCDIDDLIWYEQRAMDIYRDTKGWEMMYNMLPTAGSSLGYRHTPELKAFMVALNTGRKHTPEERKKQSERQKGRKISPETRAKRSVLLKGRKFTPEHRAKLSEAQRLRWKRKKMCQ